MTGHGGNRQETRRNGPWARRVLGALTLVLAVLVSGPATSPSIAASESASHDAALHMGVASCASSTCHGRQEATGPRVRQNELMTWQDPASLSGAHARAWTVLASPRSRDMARRLGISNPQTSAECIACHSDPAPIAAALCPV